jgi:pyruvate dehydrogenase E1 component
LLDNIGSLTGLRHEALAVRKHSKCGRPSEIYRFHGIDADAIVEAVGKVLSETAMERVEVSPMLAQQLTNDSARSDARFQKSDDTGKAWQDLWPSSRRH